jgi:rod shape determining protein RodA
VQYQFQSNIFLHKLTKLPFFLLFIIFIISSFGVAVLYSVSGGGEHNWAYKQIINFCVFLPIAIFIAIINIKIFFKFSYIFYFVALILLIMVDFNIFSVVAKGANRWINLGVIKLQPSELIKPTLVIVIARYCHQLHAGEINKTSAILPLLLLIIIPAGLVIKQPDLGTGIIILLISLVMLFVAGVALWKFIALGITVIGSLPILWNLLHDYQKRRILVFFNPDMDPLGSGYNIIQSKIAVGSGGFWGKGFMQGTQSHLDFLPEYQTDFIFSSLAEEVGFFGSASLIVLYSVVILLFLTIAFNCKTIFAKLVVVGISTIFFSHVFINISMVLGLLPAVGVPLPLISYGGTMMGATLIGVGFVMSAHIHKNYSVLN